MKETIEMKYVWGMDRQLYIVGPDILNGKLLIHSSKGTRLFITSFTYKDNYIHWNSYKEYSAEEKFYYYAEAIVLNDIEVDLCEKLKKDIFEISKERYELLRSGGR